MNVTALQPIGPSDPIATTQDPMLALIDRAARDPSIPLDRMRELLAMRSDMAREDAKRQFAAALVQAQSEMGRISRDAVNPQTRSKYATLAQMDRMLRPIYSAHGLGLTFNTDPEAAPENTIRVICTVEHIGGHSRHYYLDMPADGKGAQGNNVMTRTHAAGSALSYAQRYLIKMIFNVATGEDDDDGVAAGQTAARIPGVCILPHQIEELQTLIAVRSEPDKIAAWTKGFCTRMKVDSLAAIPIGRFQEAVDLIKTKPELPK